MPRVHVTRERVISAIYETVIRPELYDAFMAAWEEHVAEALNARGFDLGSFGDSDVLGLDPELKAHFARAHQILEQIGRTLPQTSLMDQVSDSRMFAVLLTPDGQTVAASAPAREILGDGWSIAALENRLAAGSVLLLEALRGAARTAPDTAAPVVLTIDAAPRHLLARVAHESVTGSCSQVMIVIEALEYQWSDAAEAMLVNSFALSRAEVDIVRNLLAGHSLREIAHLSGRSEHTVRNQAKAVLAKTGAPGQVDLIRLVVFLINQQDQQQAPEGSKTLLPGEVLSMASGYRMQVFSTGPRTGRPVIFLHGMLDGVAPLRFLQDELRRCNFRVVAPIRPGFGRSDPVPAGAMAMDVFTGHVAELIERYDLERPVILGHLAGAVHGHVIAHRLRDRVAGMVAVSGSAPVCSIRQLSRMAPRQRIVAYTARFAPGLLPPVLRAGIAQIDSKDIGGFMDALYAPGTHDHGVIQSLGLTDVIQSEYRFSVQQGHVGFAGDSHFVVRDWGPLVDGDVAPVVYLNGGLDPVADADSVRKFLGNRPGASSRILPEAGQLLLYEYPTVVCRAVEDLINAPEI